MNKKETKSSKIGPPLDQIWETIKTLDESAEENFEKLISFNPDDISSYGDEKISAALNASRSLLNVIKGIKKQKEEGGSFFFEGEGGWNKEEIKTMEEAYLKAEPMVKEINRKCAEVIGARAEAKFVKQESQRLEPLVAAYENKSSGALFQEVTAAYEELMELNDQYEIQVNGEYNREKMEAIKNRQNKLRDEIAVMKLVMGKRD